MEEGNITEAVARLGIQLAVILVAAKLGGEVVQRYLRLPSVLGELTVGVIIGPFALGSLEIPGYGALFPRILSHVDGSLAQIPVSLELYSISQVASIVLLFVIGLESDLRQFLRYAGPAAAVALGGVALPFALGLVGTALLSSSLLGQEFGFSSPEALFIATAMTATSIGITARVLTDLGALDSAEGVTVVAAAVIDDVIGIIVLTVVVGVSVAGVVSASNVAWVGFKAIAFWLGLTGGGILVAPYISRMVAGLRVSGAGVAVFLGLAFLASGLAEEMGLALIIGAYSMGLALSRTELAKRLRESFDSVYYAVVPIFFVVMGMLVDVNAMAEALAFGVIITALAIVGKVFGSGLPAALAGFNMRGSWRVGFGMLPRGEVALIIAGIGLARGVIDQDIFGVTIMMTVVTTLIAPIVLVPLFKKGGSGRRSPAEAQA